MLQMKITNLVVFIFYFFIYTPYEVLAYFTISIRHEVWHTIQYTTYRVIL